MNLRIVFDTSTLVSAALRVDSTPYKAFHKALSAFELCSSHETLMELERILAAPKFDRYVSAGSRREFIEQFRANAQHYTVPVDLYGTLVPPCRCSSTNCTRFMSSREGASAKGAPPS